MYSGQYEFKTPYIQIAIDAPTAFSNLYIAIHELNHRYANLSGKWNYPWWDEGFTDMLAWDKTVEIAKKLAEAGDTRFKPPENGGPPYKNEVAVARAA